MGKLRIATRHGSRLPFDSFLATAMIKIEESLPSSDLTMDEE